MAPPSVGAEMCLILLLSFALIGCEGSTEPSPDLMADPIPDPVGDPIVDRTIEPMPSVSPDSTFSSAMRCGYHGYCRTETKGFITKSPLRLPDIEVPPDTKEFEFSIPNKCAEWGRDLAGCVVHACDSDAAPALRLAEAGVGAASLRRQGAAQTPANIYMKQYCV